MPEPMIAVENVSKKYCKSLKRSMLYGLSDIARNMVGLGTHSERLRPNEFWAVNDISVEVRRGETLGLIGPNGSGKTTLLKMLNGIFWPDRGKISIRGRVGALIAVGAGFHPLLTGRENIFVNGAILGMTRAEMRRNFDAIVEFAGIPDFLDTPVKHYSSGMFVRLGFAIAIHCEPDILLVDEVLAVGDLTFQAKCINKMKELDARQVTKIFVSHSLNSVSLLCNKCLYLKDGRLRHYGETADVLNEYKKDVLMLSGSSGSDDNESRYGTREITIESVRFVDASGNEKSMFKRGEKFQIRIGYQAKKKISHPEFSVGIFHESMSTNIIKATTRDHGITVESVEGDGEVTYTIDALPLNLGRYFVTIGAWDSTGHVAYDHHEKLYEFVVEDGAIGGKIRERFGFVHVPATWQVASSGQGRS